MLRFIVIKLVEFYQFFFSSPGGFLSLAGGQGCPQNPSCSEYTIEKIKKEGVLRGLLFGGKRILKCNPW